VSDAINLKHHFLLAMPGLVTDYFGNTITYICEHNETGAMGLMINRPTELPLAKLLEQLGMDVLVKLKDPVLEGGPVGGEHGFVLHTEDPRFDSSVSLGNGLALSTAKQTLQAIGAGTGPARYLVALGYAGWAGGQLENELAQNAWLTCPANLEVLFDVPYAQRVDQAAATLGIDFKLMSRQAGRA
jgi:putative transcriptional regulator